VSRGFRRVFYYFSMMTINRSFNTFRSIQCEQFKEKLIEIRGWGQADRHFAAHYFSINIR
jgi:hypothetical protein